MARIKGLAVSNLQGRLGNMVFRNRGGENIVSQRPASVKNPRTRGQQLQRMIMSTVVQAYSGLKFITDHSFEGRTYGAKNMERFMKLNLDKLRGAGEFGTYIARGNASIAPFNFIISEGSLPSVPVELNDGTEWRLGNQLPSGVTLTTLTLQQFINAFGAELGDQITFVNIGSDLSRSFPTADGKQLTEYITRYARVTLKVSYTSEELSTPVLNNGTPKAELFDEVVFPPALTLGLSANSQFISMDGNFETLIIGGAVILSRKSGQTWQRSSQTLVVDDADVEGYTLKEVLPTYDPTSPYYLNNANA